MSGLSLCIRQSIDCVSEPKYIVSLLGRKLDINYSMVEKYLIFGYRKLFSQYGETFFDGLRRVKNAEIIRVDRDLVKYHRHYWYFEDKEDNLSYDGCVDVVHDVLVESVGMRLRSDVPIAFALSGGIDSNSIFHIANLIKFCL